MKKLFALLLVAILVIGTPMTARANTPIYAGAVTVSYGSLHVRSGASTSHTVLTSLPKGSYITLLSKSGSWWKVQYGDGLYGYCHADYITAIEGRQSSVAVNWGTLNVRSGAGTNHARVASLSKGDSVLVLSSGNGWSRILYHGTKTGYVSSAYLSGNPAKPTGISLAVPSYKQTDSRWSGVKIGSSGKTIGQIGCTTTGIAMMESYRTGTTITPDVMSRRLSYTASGNVYWPSDYRVTTSYNLSNIASLLQAGKPVLIGARNAYGAQHWVVIIGYNGQGLSAANFSIHDPGSNSRTNLQQFLNVYPSFYKYFNY
ncbi:MAG: SH3 domain-containing protein [Clostridia bacterium]|nr:SH3 domain-containing protein [Clostridia bacterium]